MLSVLSRRLETVADVIFSEIYLQFGICIQKRLYIILEMISKRQDNTGKIIDLFKKR